MEESLSKRIQIFCAWCGPAFVVLYGLTWCVLGHNYPPPNPAFTAQELVDNFYLKYQGSIMLGESLSAATGILYLVWACQLTVQMWRREKTPILSILQLAGGLLTGWVLIFSPALWAWCAEMAGTVSPELIKAVHFMAWYVFDMTYMITTVEVAALFVLVMADKTKPALMPKWAAALALFSGLSFLPLSFLPYFKSGPFAINGYWSFHVAFISYGLFTAIIGPYMAADIKRVKIPATPALAQALSRSQSIG
jgi:magnesium-transporting ATPase (P-type)